MPAPEKLDIAKLYHPNSSFMNSDHEKWRYCYKGGTIFKEKYLKRFSTRETDDDFVLRRDMTYCPAFAKQGVDEIKNSIYQRMVDIVRESPSANYKRRVQGLDTGVDGLGSSMNYFIGCKVLPELLVMSKVGIYVDMPKVVSNINFQQAQKLSPYIYLYSSEQIVNWSRDRLGRYTQLLLEDLTEDYDETTGLPIGNVERYRYLWLENGVVNYQFYTSKGEMTDENGFFQLDYIPFYLAEISNSLMADVADYQIALLNIASSDISYITKANFPLYVENYDPGVEMFQHFAKSGTSDDSDTQGSNATSNVAANKETVVGSTVGRRFPKGIELPKFINPSAEPIKASIEKQEQMKKEIRSLLYLSLANLEPTRSSADSKQVDISREENGLSYIGQTLESAERFILKTWVDYENIRGDGHVSYPATYEIKPLARRIDIGLSGLKLVEGMPSTSFKKELLAVVAKSVLGNTAPEARLTAIVNELEKLETVVVDTDNLSRDIENGLVSTKTASLLRGYPEDEAEKAEEEKIERAREIALAQSAAKETPDDNPGARGVDDLSADPKEEVKSERTNPDGTAKRKRGKGRKPPVQ